MPTISIISAIAENNVIGNNNQLIWRLPADLKHFKQLTLGHAMVMGRKTFDSIGKPLPGRKSVIVTRDPSYKQEGCSVAHSLEEALQELEDQEEIFIIGGAEIYKQTIGLANKMYITHINQSFEGDAFFPAIHTDEWSISDLLEVKADEKNPLSYSFVTYTRK